jgi:hypothetical protein
MSYNQLILVPATAERTRTSKISRYLAASYPLLAI